MLTAQSYQKMLFKVIFKIRYLVHVVLGAFVFVFGKFF